MSAGNEPTRGHRPLADPPADRRPSVARRPRGSLVGRCLIDKLAKLDLSGIWQISGSSPWNSPPREWIAPHQGQLISPSSSAGTARLATAHPRNVSLTQRMSGPNRTDGP